MKKIYVLCECGCPMVHAETELDLIYWYKDRLKRFAGDTDDIVRLEGLICRYEFALREDETSNESRDLFDRIMEVLDFYEVNFFEIPSI